MRIIQITDTITTLKEKYLRTIREQKGGAGIEAIHTPAICA